MARNCVKYPLEEFLEEYSEYFKDCQLIKVDIYIDNKIVDDIIQFLKGNENKFKRILYEIIQGHYPLKLYRKEPVSKKAKNITAMKFSGKLNSRIYCKEFFMENGKKIVMINLLEHKDFQSAQDKRLKSKLESIGGYKYEF